MKIYFVAETDGTVSLRARAEGPGEIGDMNLMLWPGGQFHGLDYAVLCQADAGIINLGDDGIATIEDANPPPAEPV